MKISRLEFKNCLGIKELKLTPGQITMITGGNGKGKTSILESIEKAISNKDRRVKFVNDDADKAELIIELDNGISINRKVNSDNKSSLKVTSGDFSMDKPQTFLDGLLGGFGFNPIDFIQQDDKKQSEMLLNIIPIQFSLDDFEGIFGELPDGMNYKQHPLKLFKDLEKKFFDARADENKEVKVLKSEVDAIFKQLPDAYNAETYRNVNLSDLYKDIDEKQRVNDNIVKSQEYISNKDTVVENIRDKYETLKTNIVKDIDEEINTLKLKIATLETQREEKHIALHNEMKVKFDEVKENVKVAEKYISAHIAFDIESLKADAENTETMKNFVNLSDNKTRLEIDLTKKETKAKMLNDQVELARSTPIDLLKKFELPVDGLAFSEDMTLLINDRPIKNLSTAEAMKVALDIARATAGELKVICIDKFESVDEELQAEIIEQIKDDDFMYFITEVTGGDMKIEDIK